MAIFIVENMPNDQHYCCLGNP